MPHDGEVNAVAFFFALDMGGGELLLSSAKTAATGAAPTPAAVVASSWKQAVQRLRRPARCGPGRPLRVLASHDTYGISFEWAEAAAAAAQEEEEEGGPTAQRPPRAARELVAAAAAAEARLGAPLARAVAQDPLAYRRLARAAVRLALAQEEGASAVGAVAGRMLA